MRCPVFDSESVLRDPYERMLVTNIRRPAGDVQTWSKQFDNSTDHPIWAITSISASARDRHFLSGSDGHGLGGFWTCRGAIGIAMQRMAPRMAPKRHTVHRWPRDVTLAVQGFTGTPGGTRIPNLLIRSQEVAASGPISSPWLRTRRPTVVNTIEIGSPDWRTSPSRNIRTRWGIRP